MSLKAVFYAFAIINNSSLVVYRPTRHINAAYMCTEFSNSGSIKSNCTWPYEWTAMKMEDKSILNKTMVPTFEGKLINRFDFGTFLFYKIKFVNANRTYFDTDWNSLIWNLDDYKSLYNNILHHGDSTSTIMVLISAVLTQVTLLCSYHAYRILGKTSFFVHRQV